MQAQQASHIQVLVKPYTRLTFLPLTQETWPASSHPLLLSLEIVTGSCPHFCHTRLSLVLHNLASASLRGGKPPLHKSESQS